MTKRRGILPVSALLLLLATRAGGGAEAPDPMEVYELIRANLPGVTDAQLQTAAVEGLVKALEPRVWLVGADNGTKVSAPAPLLAKVAVYDGPVLYLRVGRVGAGLAEELIAAYTAWSATNALKGVALDLRFADGDDYAAAAQAADLVMTKEQLLLDWGAGSARSSAKTEAPNLPIAVLVNRQTSGAAEALAAVVRDVGSGLVIGAATAGRATIAEEFTLKNGQRLRIAKAGIKLGSGATLSAEGVKPDIVVAIRAADEQSYWADPFKDLSPGANLIVAPGAPGTNTPAEATNRPARRRLNEAELVRERREGVNGNLGSDATPAPRAERDRAVVRDPVLARALDLIQGLAVVRQLRSP
jgi:hypothetical protein